MTTRHVSVKHSIELGEDRDFPAGIEPSFRYSILSTLRSGSTLLGRILRETGMAGDPLEYFAPELLKTHQILTDDAACSQDKFIEIMLKKRTSPNGYFGMKIHYHQWLSAFGSNKPTTQGVDFLRKHNSLIWLRRRDKFSQAVSMAMAQKTGAWTSETKNIRPVTLESFNTVHLTYLLFWLVNEDAGWKAFFETTGCPYLEVWYEDLYSDYDRQVARICDYLHIAPPAETQSVKPIQKQAGELSGKVRSILIESLGLNASEIKS